MLLHDWIISAASSDPSLQQVIAGQGSPSLVVLMSHLLHSPPYCVGSASQPAVHDRDMLQYLLMICGEHGWQLSCQAHVWRSEQHDKCLL
jgi:hypothetical protein